MLICSGEIRLKIRRLPTVDKVPLPCPWDGAMLITVEVERMTEFELFKIHGSFLVKCSDNDGKWHLPGTRGS